MAAFNNRTQAREFIAGFVTRSPRPVSGRDDKIRSIATERDYTNAAVAIAAWAKTQDKDLTLLRMSRKQALAYLEERAEAVGQKTLDRDRVVLNRLPRVKLPLRRIESTAPPGRQLAEESRAYDGWHIDEVASRQNAPSSLATRIAAACGLRAHEILTLKRKDRLTKSQLRELGAHGKWNPNRFKGLSGVRYVVTGKGGLMREIVVPHHLARELEARYVAGGFKTVDRKIFYTQFYRISGGQKWSSSFSTASKRAFGWSRGAHACRHTYAQNRLSVYRDAGLERKAARELVSQEMGHFRARITETYLR